MTFHNEDRADSCQWILLAHCEDRPGLVAGLASWIARRSGNIEKLDQHVDGDSNHFFVRINWTEAARNRDADPEAMQADLLAHLGSSDMEVTIHAAGKRARIGVFVSRHAHCLFDILGRWYSGEWNADIACVISNHEDLRAVAEGFGIPYYCIPIQAETKAAQEQQELELLAEHKVDLIILARYMQVLTPTLIEPYAGRIINIHHSSLPAFAGARPYHAAFERGVKTIGATSHYVTAELDAGPIIEQDTAHVSHRETVNDLVQKGRDLEKVVLARAVEHHLNHRVLAWRNRTIVFA